MREEAAGREREREEELKRERILREREIALKRFVNFVERLRPHIARKSAATLGRVWRGHVGRRAHREARREHQYRQKKSRELAEMEEEKKLIAAQESEREAREGGGAGGGEEGVAQGEDEEEVGRREREEARIS